MPERKSKADSSFSSRGVGRKTEDAADVKDRWAEETLLSIEEGRRALPDLTNPQADSMDEANDGATSERLLSSDSPLMEKRRDASLAAGINRFSSSSKHPEPACSARTSETICIDFGRCCILEAGRPPRNERLQPAVEPVGLVRLLSTFDDLDREVFMLVPGGSCCPSTICRLLAVLVAELGPEVGLLTDPDADHAVAIFKKGRENLEVELLLRRVLASFADTRTGLDCTARRRSGQPYSHVATCCGVTSTSSIYH